jgi:hypothetical protein
MSVPTSACCAVTTLSQQQENNIQHHQDYCADTQPKGDRSTSKNCTVVENGRVVVKTVNA